MATNYFSDLGYTPGQLAMIRAGKCPGCSGHLTDYGKRLVCEDEDGCGGEYFTSLIPDDALAAFRQKNNSH